MGGRSQAAPCEVCSIAYSQLQVCRFKAQRLYSYLITTFPPPSKYACLKVKTILNKEIKQQENSTAFEGFEVKGKSNFYTMKQKSL